MTFPFGCQCGADVDPRERQEVVLVDDLALRRDLQDVRPVLVHRERHRAAVVEARVLLEPVDGAPQAVVGRLAVEVGAVRRADLVEQLELRVHLEPPAGFRTSVASQTMNAPTVSSHWGEALVSPPASMNLSWPSRGQRLEWMKRWSELVPLAIRTGDLTEPAVLRAGRPQRDRLARAQDDAGLDLADVVAARPPAAPVPDASSRWPGSRASVERAGAPPEPLCSRTRTSRCGRPRP